MSRITILLLALILSAPCALGQSIKNASYQTVGYIKYDGTVQDAGYRTIGHIRSDGTVQDAGYRTIGHADGIRLEWAALFFIFSLD